LYNATNVTPVSTYYSLTRSSIFQITLNQDTTNSLDISTTSTSAYETGNEITGASSSSETANTTDSTSATETNQTSNSLTSSTTVGTDTNQRDGKALSWENLRF
jgi:hypothetical protein